MNSLNLIIFFLFADFCRMSWQKSSGAFRVICGVVIGAGTAWIIQKNKDDDHPKVQVKKAASTGQNFLPLQKVLASWTTNFSPSVPWDNNWDRCACCLYACSIQFSAYVSLHAWHCLLQPYW